MLRPFDHHLVASSAVCAAGGVVYAGPARRASVQLVMIEIAIVVAVVTVAMGFTEMNSAESHDSLDFGYKPWVESCQPSCCYKSNYSTKLLPCQYIRQ
jgi:hypothetical protein